MLAAALCAAWRLTLDEQGLFFVFLSLGALLQLSDFGIAYAALHMSGHLRIDGDAARFNGFLARARRINLVVLSVAATAVFALGVAVFSARAGRNGAQLAWGAPWAAFVLAALVAQLSNLELTFIEGGRSPIEAWRCRWGQEVVGGLALVALLFGGAGLWSLCAYWGTRAGWTLWWLRHNRLQIADVPEARASSSTRFNWRSEVWPFQWRIGLSSLSGFLIFQAFNPIVLVEQGPALAGRFGMSLAMMNMLLAVTLVWPLSQISRYVGLIVERRFAQLRHDFWRMLAASGLFAAILAGSLFAVLWWMSGHHVSFAGRTADLLTTGALLAAAVVHHVVNCFAVVLRAERREPLMAVSIVGGLLTVLVVWASARYGGLPQIALANLGCALIGVPIAFVYYQSFMARGKRNGGDESRSTE